MKFNKLRLGAISRKLTLIYAGIFFLVLTLLNTGILFGVYYILMKQATEQITDISDKMINQFHESDQKMADLRDKDLLVGIPSNDNIYVKIVDKDGKIVNESAKFNLRIPEQIPFKVNKIAIFHKELLYQNRVIMAHQKPYAYLQVVKSLSNEIQFLKVLIFLMLGVELLSVFISILSGLVISREMLKPISHITTMAQNISIHDLNQRIKVNGPQDELSKLAMTFNEMIDRLQKSFDGQNQFVSDASHELRTPISVIQGYINMLDRWGKEDKAILQESITAIKNEAANMAELIEKLLFLARVDSSVARERANNLCREYFQFNELVNEVFKETRVIASQHQILLQRNDEIAFLGDRKMLKQMIRALIDNSIKFTPSPGEIFIYSYRENDTAMLIIQDTGVGIPEADIPYIFNRFYQVDKTRNKTHTGSGLGLAIVKWIVDAHQGAIKVESGGSGEGTSISITFPLEKQC